MAIVVMATPAAWPKGPVAGRFACLTIVLLIAFMAKGSYGQSNNIGL